MNALTNNSSPNIPPIYWVEIFPRNWNIFTCLLWMSAIACVHVHVCVCGVINRPPRIQFHHPISYMIVRMFVLDVGLVEYTYSFDFSMQRHYYNQLLNYNPATFHIFCIVTSILTSPEEIGTHIGNKIKWQQNYIVIITNNIYWNSGSAQWSCNTLKYTEEVTQ